MPQDSEQRPDDAGGASEEAAADSRKATDGAAESPAPKKRAKGAGVPVRKTVDRVRTLVARLVWLVSVLAALALAVGALLIVLDANRDNALVTFVLDAADVADLGVFDLDNGIKTFTGEDAETKNALVNWGLGALAWLIAGRILERLIRPSRTM